MEKLFNTAGPVIAENNYMIDPLKRINKDEIMTLIDNWRYFILHAPGKREKHLHCWHFRIILTNKVNTSVCM